MSTTEQHRKWRAKNRDKVTINSYNSKERHFAKYILKRVKDSSRKRGIIFDLNEQWIQERLDTGFCEATGISFDCSIGTGRKGGKRNPYGPSVDRIDTDQGYIPENCQMVLWMYNAAKGSWSEEDVLKMALALIRQKEQ